MFLASKAIAILMPIVGAGRYPNPPRVILARPVYEVRSYADIPPLRVALEPSRDPVNTYITGYA